MNMKKLLLDCMVLCLVGLMGQSVAADQKAYLRTDDNKTYYVSVSVSNWKLTGADLKDKGRSLFNRLKANTDSVSRYITGQLSPETLSVVQNYDPARPPNSRLRDPLLSELNRLIKAASFYDPDRFAGVTLRAETKALLAEHPQGERLSFLNRMLLDDAYSQEISQNSSLRPLWRDQNGNSLKSVVASMYYKGRLVPITIEPTDVPGSDFKLSFSNQEVLKEGLDSLEIAVHSYPVSRDETNGFKVAVTNEVTNSLEADSGQCIDGFPVKVAVDPGIEPQPYAYNRLKALRKEMIDKYKPAVQIEAHSWDEPQDWSLKPISQPNEPSEHDPRFVLCYMLAKDPPTGTFDILFKYAADAPMEFRRPIFKGGIVNAGHALAPASIDTGDVGKRTLEQNLDVGVQYTSSVKDKTEKDASGMDVKVRKRENVGTLDLRLAPWLNILDLPDPRSTTFKFFTPFLIDARVSTGKIDKDTLSLNRIAMGPQFEIRHYSDPQTYPTYQRYIFTVTNASDRDFKQAEWKGTFEFQPVFSAFNRPLSFRTRNFDPELDPDPNRAQDDIPIKTGFGQQVLPVFGVEMGKTYRNKHGFAAIEQSEFVRRFYFGGTINLNLTSYVTLSVKDILYIRGEAPKDRLHNYFLGTVSVPLPSFASHSANSAFFSFERGGQPPFATPDVNTFKVGYRVQWDNWFGQRR
jgi:hypothetical protein